MKKQKERDEKILAKEKEIAENFKKEVTTIKCSENDLKFAEHMSIKKHQRVQKICWFY